MLSPCHRPSAIVGTQSNGQRKVRQAKREQMKRRGCDPAIKTNTAVPRGQEEALAAVNALLKTQGGTREVEG